MSWSTISKDELERIMPVSPPMVNRATNPIAQSMEIFLGVSWPKAVAIHLNTLIPVGTAMIIVVAVK